MQKTLSLSVNKLNSEQFAFTNSVYLSTEDATYLALNPKTTGLPLGTYCLMKDYVFVFAVAPQGGTIKGDVGLSGPHRSLLQVGLGDKVQLEAWVPRDRSIYLQNVRLEVDFLSKGRKEESFEIARLTEMVTSKYVNHVFSPEQKLVMDAGGVTLLVRIVSMSAVEASALVEGAAAKAPLPSVPGARVRGILLKNTEISWTKAPGSAIRLTGEGGASATGGVMFRPDWNFENMGIGGLDAEFSSIFRRAFASRIFPPSVIQKLGINHVRGLLLYGPPGTGKTLMARQIGKMLNGKEPKVVSGPEVLSKYVGESEANIRNLFKDAEMEYKAKGDESDLHIIIFDEIDALCRQRGTRNDSTGVGDTVVNQILTKIDGVDSLNNILVIGMTNRRDMIDEALLRPGRLEVHMEISLPDEKGRVQILKIHTAKMAKNGLMDTGVDLLELAQVTKNYSGAEIEGLVKAASSFALNRQVNPNNLSKAPDASKIRVTRADFQAALSETKPAFGASKDSLEQYRPNGLIAYGPRWDKLTATASLYIAQTLNSARSPITSLLLEGRAGCGKTALAISLALSGEFPYLKLISPDDLVGYGESSKCSKIQKVFDDAYKSKVSCVIVDDLERLIEYVPVGPRFSNTILQMLLVLLKKAPPPGYRMLVIATATSAKVMEELELFDCFTGSLSVPLITEGTELKAILAELDKGFSTRDLDEVARNYTEPLPIKKLISLLEMTRQMHTTQPTQPLSSLFVSSLQEAGVAHAAKAAGF